MDTSPARGPLAVDAMGADLGPAEIVEAVRLAVQDFPDLPGAILVGQQDILDPLVAEKGLDKEARVEVFHASEVIGMSEKPIQSLKQKKDSSLVRAVELVKQGKASGILSCGNTGSLMAAGTIKLRPEVGVDRPALGIVMPSKDHHFILVDAGANPEADVTNLVHNAILGSHYCRVVLDKPKPRVGLLTIGTEEGKGNELTSETHARLKQLGGLIDYQGLIEGFQVFENHVDVVVCDGFVGNILLKTSESLFYILKDYLKEEITRTPLRTLGALLSRGAFEDMKKQLSPDQYGGAPLLGLKGLVMKAHGSSRAMAIRSAMGIASKIVQRDMGTQVKLDIEQANRLLKGEVAGLVSQ